MDRIQKEKIREMRSFFLKGLSPQGGSFLIASIADIIADGLSIGEIIALASFMGSISQMLAYIAAQRELNGGSQTSQSVGEQTTAL